MTNKIYKNMWNPKQTSLLISEHKKGFMEVRNMEKANKPKMNLRAGTLQVAVWEKELTYDGKKSIKHSVTIQKGYKDKEGKWQNTNYIDVEDLPKLTALLQCVYSRIEIGLEPEQE